jgi:hypothetical protein
MAFNKTTHTGDDDETKTPHMSLFNATQTKNGEIISN